MLTKTTVVSIHPLARMFDEAVASLPGWQRQVLTLSEADRLGAGEIGAALGISGASARVALLEARRALGRTLTERVSRSSRLAAAVAAEPLRASA